MPNTYTLLETITVGAAGASSVTFNSIPQTGYTDLVMKISAKANLATTATGGQITFNGSATGYSERLLYGNSVTAASGNRTGNFFTWSLTLPGTSVTANTFGSTEIYIPNYAQANNKSISAESITENNANSADSANIYAVAGLWSNTAAITSITLSHPNNFVQYSTFQLYGVSALGVTPTKAPKATGGSIIQTDGTYWYHAFLSSGTFTPATALSCDVLVVAGGGSGGSNIAGGGGAGGLRSLTATSVTTATTITIGAGGASKTGGGVGNSGSDTTYASTTSAGGGGGGFRASTGVQAPSGGNGGGGGGSIAGTALGGAGNTPSTSPSQGNNGGNGYIVGTGEAAGGGGGGAGATGSNGALNAGGAGGIGSNTYSTWASATGTGVSGYYAGGGGGGGNALGVGGTGGGGNGGKRSATTIAAVAGTVNTGGGGGGDSEDSKASGAGGSGIVIIRYLA